MAHVTINYNEEYKIVYTYMYRIQYNYTLNIGIKKNQTQSK